MNQQAATQPETQQSRIYLDLAVTEPERQPPPARLDVAERHAQLIGNVADQLRRAHRSPEGALSGESRSTRAWIPARTAPLKRVGLKASRP